MPVELALSDLSGSDASSRDGEDKKLSAMLQREAATPFDLVNGPLFRFKLVKLFTGEHALLVTVHHLVCDGISMGILLSEFGEHYSAAVKQSTVHGPQSTVGHRRTVDCGPWTVDCGSLEQTYSEFVQRQVAAVESPERAAAERFWLDQCAGATQPLVLPVDRPRPLQRSFTGAACEHLVRADVSDAIKKLSVARRCSTAVTLLAGCYLLLQRLSGQSTIVIGLPITLRTTSGSERLVGHCLNFVPLRLEFQGDPTFAEHLERVRAVLLGALTHSQVTLGSLLQKLNGSREHPPAISVMANVEPAPQPVELAGVSTEVKANPFCYSRFDLSLLALETGARLALRCVYSAELFDEHTIARWLEHYEELLSAAAADPACRLSQLPRLLLHTVHGPQSTVQGPRSTVVECGVRSAECGVRSQPLRTPHSAFRTPHSATVDPGPASETEQKLAGIWREVVRVDHIGRHDSFFDIGGHSLLATKVTARIVKAFGVEVPVRAVFEAPTVAELAGVIEQKLREQPNTAPHQNHAAPRSSPVSFGQRRLWFLQQVEPGSARYHIASLMRFTGRFEIRWLTEALNRIVARHETLRTRFASQGGEPVQVIEPAARLAVAERDLTTLASEEREKALEALITREVNRPFDLRGDQPLRCMLVKLDVEEHVLLTVMHHIISDEWSFRLYHGELLGFYAEAASGVRSAECGVRSGEAATLHSALRTPHSALCYAELPIQYREYAQRQQQWLQSDDSEQQLAYWKEQLSGDPSPVEIPADFPRSADRSRPGAACARALGAELSRRLRALGRTERATVFMVLLAALKALAYRYTRQEDIIIGSPVAGRNQVDLEELIGCFVNTLALRTQVSGDLTFHELLARVRETALAAYSRQELPFDRIVEALRPERALGGTPFINLVFFVQHERNEMMEVPGAKVEFLNPGVGPAVFDLALVVRDNGGEMIATAQYDASLFKPDTITRFLDHYVRLLEGIVAEPARRVSDFPILGEAEADLVLSKWNDTRAEYPRHACVHELFEEQARTRPQAVAVKFGSAWLTYAALNEQANRLAHRLHKLGVAPGSIVGLCSERSLEMVVAILGILKSGAAYAPLDHLLPKQRLARMIEDMAPAALVVTHKHLADGPLNCRLPIVGLQLSISNSAARDEWRVTRDETKGLKDQETKVRSPQSTVRSPQSTVHSPQSTVHSPPAPDRGLWTVDCGPNPASGATAESPAYISFTSGSTGQPKGVCVPHRAIVRLVRNTNYIRLEPTDVVLQMAPLAFDASTFEIWGPLLNGATLAVMPPHLPSLSELAEALERHRVTTAWFTSGLFNQIVNEKPQALKRLRQVITGGDVLSPPHVQKALLLLDSGVVINGYGPTENTTFTACHCVPPNFDGKRSVPIGRPISNTTCYVLDPALRPVPIGVPGELYAGGDGLALGYLNDPKLTAEKFVANPFQPGQRLYRTGDLVRWLADGTLEFLGRMGDQVKVRGFRVELSEIETALLGHPAVRHCAVVARPDAAGTRQIVAYVVPRSPPTVHSPQSTVHSPQSTVHSPQSTVHSPRSTVHGPQSTVHGPQSTVHGRGPADCGLRTADCGLRTMDSGPWTADWDPLRGFLAEKLPAYMIPSFFVALRELPLSRNGKVDRAALPAPDRRRAGEATTAPPRDEVEAQLQALWQEVLDVRPIGIHDRFFALGGHSLLAMRLLALVEKRFSRQLKIAELLQHPTIAGLAAVLRGEGQARSSSMVEIQPGGTRAPLFLVHGAGGGMFWGYSNLARYLGAERPLVAFKSRGMDEEEELDSIEDLAKAYIADLRAFQPSGPYCLGGYCFGGVVAYEMARQLESQGDAVAFLGLINSTAPNSAYTRFQCTPVSAVRFAANVIHRGYYSVRAHPEWAAQWAYRKARSLFGAKGLQCGVRSAECGVHSPFRTPHSALEYVDLSRYREDERRVWRKHLNALGNYHPQPYVGRVWLFRSSVHLLRCSFAADYGWRPLARGGLDVKVIRCAHEGMMEEPAVKVLAGVIGQILA